jgi:hypothetical protein
MPLLPRYGLEARVVTGPGELLTPDDIDGHVLEEDSGTATATAGSKSQ